MGTEFLSNPIYPEPGTVPGAARGVDKGHDTEGEPWSRQACCSSRCCSWSDGRPPPASAATCDDYSNQADAQRAKDTRDADGDGDGIYCEALPCPCLKPGEDSGGGGGSPRPTPAPKPKPRTRAQIIDARITSVVDGDTVKVKAFEAKRDFYTVRLLGIDTPETKKPGTPVECGGKRATASMMRLGFTEPTDADGDGLEDTEGGEGRRVTLTTDPTQATFDRFGRLLAYVTTKAGVSLETTQLSRGWAAVYVFGGKPFQRVARFRAAERRAHGRTWGMEALRRQLPRTRLSRPLTRSGPARTAAPGPLANPGQPGERERASPHG